MVHNEAMGTTGIMLFIAVVVLAVYMVWRLFNDRPRR
jgi:cell division protein FtsL